MRMIIIVEFYQVLDYRYWVAKDCRLSNSVNFDDTHSNHHAIPDIPHDAVLLMVAEMRHTFR